MLSHGLKEEWISQKEHDFLLCNNPRIPTFLMLPKIPKNLEHPPGRPILIGNESVMEPASKFLDFFSSSSFSLRTELPSFIQDRTHVLNKAVENWIIISSNDGCRISVYQCRSHGRTRKKPYHIIWKSDHQNKSRIYSITCRIFT